MPQRSKLVLWRCDGVKESAALLRSGRFINAGNDFAERRIPHFIKPEFAPPVAHQIAQQPPVQPLTSSAQINLQGERVAGPDAASDQGPEHRQAP